MSYLKTSYIIQRTNLAIQKLIDTGNKVQSINLLGNHIRLDIGTYWEAPELSPRYAIFRMQ